MIPIEVYMIGVALLVIAGIVLAMILWDELVDAMGGFARRGHRARHDPDRTVQLRVQEPRAAARARVAPPPLQRGRRWRRRTARHRRE